MKQTKTANSDKLKDGRHWERKYTDKQILDMYYGKAFSLDPMVEATSDEELLEFMDTFMDYDEDTPEGGGDTVTS